MKQKQLLLTAAAALALTAVPAMALLQVNGNALVKAPAINSVFERPPAQLDPKAAEAQAEAEAKVKAPALALTAAPDGTALPALVASVYDYASGTIGMYRLPELSGGEMEKISDVSSYYGGALSGNLYYACHDGRYADYWDTDYDPHGHKIQAYDINTWEKVGSEIYVNTYRAGDLAIHPETGYGYAYCDYGSMMFNLYKIDLKTGTQENLMPGTSLFSGEDARALAFDSEGTLWAVSKAGNFGKVDFLTGKVTTIAHVCDQGSYQQGWSGVIDPDSGNFIFMWNGQVGGDNVSRLYSIDVHTGIATLLADFTGKCITSMYIMPDQIEDGAPGVPTDASAAFEGGSLSGKVNFKMPAALHDGSPASGSATWKVYDGKEKVADGTAQYGAEVSADVTVTAGGSHSFSVAASNTVGEGKKLRLKAWIGPDVPVTPGNIKVDFDEPANKFTVTWDAVTTGANGGYVNPSAITYTVTRMPGDVEVAKGISATSAVCEYAPEGIEPVSFKVTAAQGELVSEPGLSDATMTGALQLPYDMSEISKSDRLENWTVIDVNKDGKTWAADNYYGVFYSYSNDLAADDWAIMPPIKAYKGNKYKIRAVFSCQMSSDAEKVEVKAGYAPTAEAMEVELLPVTVIDKTSEMPFEFDMVPDRDGKMFIGFHAVSDAYKYRLKIVGLTISAPVNESAPAAPEITQVVADPTGALKATGKVIVPKLADNGTTLSSVSALKVMRGADVVATIENPVPGTTVDFSDESVPKNGEYTYTACAYNGDMAGRVSEPFKMFVGVDVPGEVKNITISRVAGNNSQVTVKWDKPLVDRYGYPLNGDVSYSIEVYPDNAYYHGNKTYEGITANEYTLTPTFDTGLDQGFVFVKVRAVNTAGSGYASKSANIYCGAPLKLPFKESFPNYSLEHPWGDGDSNGPQIASISDDERAIQYNQFNGWNRMADASFQSADGAQDGDNGFAGMFGWSYVEDEQGNYHNEWTELISPAIDLSGVDNPMLTFYLYNWYSPGFKNNNTLDVDVVTADGIRKNLRTIVMKDLGQVQAWEHVAIDLSAYAGQTVSLIFKGMICADGDNGFNWILLDNINIKKIAAVDLGITEIKAPVQAVPNEPFTITARVSNLGSKDVATHKAVLYHNDVEVDSKELGALPFSKSEVVEFSHALEVKDPIGNVMKITVVAEGDEVADNNSTAEVIVARNLKLLPEPRDVSFDAELNKLAWSEPDFSAAVPEMVVEGFESYPSGPEGFSTEAGEWIFVDIDKAPIGGMVNLATMEVMDFPGIPTHSTQSWWVQSRVFEEFNDTYFGYDGSIQYLANMYVVNSSFNKAVQQDDWAITPELCGQGQLITLWARSYNRDTPETIEFLYSDGSTTPDDFKLISRVEQLPGDWTQYAIVVPDGARRFAIRGCSFAETGTAQTFVDDVAFYPASGTPQELEIQGYNVYCDNSLINSVPVTALDFVELPEGNHEYAVSAVYKTGESRAVPASDGSGIDNAAVMSVRISARDGMIVITGLDGAGYRVVNTSGMSVAAGSGCDNAEIPVMQGIYLVTVNGLTTKIAVR